MKTITKKMISGLGIITLLAVGLAFMPTNASAQYSWRYSQDYDYQNQNNYSASNYYQGPVQAPVYQAPAYVAPQVASTLPQTIYSSSTNPNGAKIVTSSSTKKVASNTTAKSTNTENSNLAANALFGSNSFLPSGAVQWIIFLILILLVIILVRKVSGGDKNYHQTPLKHA